jgi:hypothetical protein
MYNTPMDQASNETNARGKGRRRWVWGAAIATSLLIFVGIGWVVVGVLQTPRQAGTWHALPGGTRVFMPDPSPEKEFGVWTFGDVVDIKPVGVDAVPPNTIDDDGNVSVAYEIKVKVYKSPSLPPELVGVTLETRPFTKGSKSVPVRAKAFKFEDLLAMVARRRSNSSITPEDQAKASSVWRAWIIEQGVRP